MRRDGEKLSVGIVASVAMACVVGLALGGAAWWTIPVILVFAFLIVLAIFAS